jgi:hypothetical protein
VTPNNDIRICLLDMKHSRSKNVFCGMNIKKLRKRSLFHISYLITIMSYLCSQWTPNVEIKYFMFDCSIYSLFVLNRSWKHDSLQRVILVHVCSTWGTVELKTRFETWITGYDVNGVSLFNLPYLITLMAYLCSQWTLKVQIKCFMFDWSI